MTKYQTVKKSANGLWIAKASKFQSYAFESCHTDQIHAHLLELRKKHPKASHYCYAYKIGLDNNNYRANDDGEPSGSAGKPILGQINSFELTNVLVVVVRYYGGTKLGVSGLINAYKKAAQLALEQAGKVEKEINYMFEVSCDYLAINDLLNHLKNIGVDPIEKQFLEDCKLTFEIGESKASSLNEWLIKKSFKFTKKINH